ncbi:hypothetical protein Q7P37_007945 [Cladosporium fusiforme]
MSSAKRRIIACERCHAKKIKCFGGSPCENCHSGNYQCTYPVRDKNVSVSEAYIRELQYAASLAHTSVAQGATVSHSSRPQTAENPPQRPLPTPSSDTAAPEPLQNALLRDSTAETFVDGLRRLGSESTGSQSRNKATTYEPTFMGNGFHSHIKLHTEDFVNGNRIKLPPLSHASQLVQQFESFIGHEYCWYDRACFHQRFRTTYREPNNPQARERLWLSQLFAVLALGASYNSYDAPCISFDDNINGFENEGAVPNKDDGDNGSPPGVAFYEQALSLFELHPEAPRIGNVEALNLLAFYSYSLNRRKTAHMYIGISLRVASSLELDASVSDPPSHELTHRKHVWMTTLILDSTTTIALGLRPGYSATHVELQSLTERTTAGPEPHDTMQSNLIAQHLKLCNIQAKIHHTARRLKAADFTDYRSAIHEPLAELKRWESELPTQLSVIFSPSSFPEMPKLVEGRSLASLYLRHQQGYISLIRPVFFKIFTILVGRNTSDSSLGDLLELGDMCSEAAERNLKVLQSLHDLDKLAKFGFWDSLHLSSAIMIAILARRLGSVRATPPGRELPSEHLITSCKLLLSDMAGGGNAASKIHVAMLEDVERLLSPVSGGVAHPVTTDISDEFDLDSDIFQWIHWTGFDFELPPHWNEQPLDSM